jgi:hypothetical protein
MVKGFWSRAQQQQWTAAQSKSGARLARLSHRAAIGRKLALPTDKASLRQLAEQAVTGTIPRKP